jgi:hypothetical protein
MSNAPISPFPPEKVVQSFAESIFLAAHLHIPQRPQEYCILNLTYTQLIRKPMPNSPITSLYSALKSRVPTLAPAVMQRSQ